MVLHNVRSGPIYQFKKFESLILASSFDEFLPRYYFLNVFRNYHAYHQRLFRGTFDTLELSSSLIFYIQIKGEYLNQNFKPISLNFKNTETHTYNQ